MIKQISRLLDLQLKNFMNINVYANSKDIKKKKETKGRIWVYGILIFILWSYEIAICVGLSSFGMGELIPPMIVLIATCLIFLLTMIQAGGTIFETKSMDNLLAMPFGSAAIVISRYLRMYIEEVCISFATILPAIVIQAVMERGIGIGFYLFYLLAIVITPLFPISIATIVGAIITGITSRLRHKGLVYGVFSVLSIAGILLLSGSSPEGIESLAIMKPDAIKNLVLDSIQSTYPPAIWMGNAINGVQGSLKDCLLFVVLSLFSFVVMAVLVSIFFKPIIRAVAGTSARHNYRITSLSSAPLKNTLLTREFRRYISSGIYIANTLCGPIMALVFSIALSVIYNQDDFVAKVGIGRDVVDRIYPVFIALIICMMTTTCSSISMEGKNWWQLESLPVKAEDLYYAKIKLNFIAFVPFVFISQIIMLITVRPSIALGLLYLIVPYAYLFFAAVWGLFINIKFPMFDWENDAQVVKQSTAVLLGGLGGMGIAGIASIPYFVFSGVIGELIGLVTSAVFVVVGLLLFNRVKKYELINISN